MFKAFQMPKGFTLLEVMIALAIFALLGVTAWRGLSHLLEISQRLKADHAVLTQVAQLDTYLRQDLSQISPRSIRDEFGDQRAAIDHLNAQHVFIEFTRSGISNPFDVVMPGLARVSYRLDNGQLIRRQFAQLDRTQSTPFVESILADGINNVNVRLLDNKGKWQTSWQFEDQQGNRQLQALPAAIEIQIEWETLGQQMIVVPLLNDKVTS